MSQWKSKLEEIREQAEQIKTGGGEKAIARQHSKNRLTARERINQLIDPDSDFLEIGLWAAWGMYQEWGGCPSACVVCGVGKVAGRLVMIAANDATIKAGAFFPMTCKKLLRAQKSPWPTTCPPFIWSIRRACSYRYKTRSFPTKTISDGSFSTTQS